VNDDFQDLEAPEPAPVPDTALGASPESLSAMLELLTAGEADLARIGRRAVLLGFAVGARGPRNLGELAARLGVSVATAWRAEKAFTAEIERICPEFEGYRGAGPVPDEKSQIG